MPRPKRGSVEKVRSIRSCGGAWLTAIPDGCGIIKFMKDSTHFYFAYGSNLNHADWTAWCRRKGYPENLLEPLFPAWLPDRQLRFTSYSHSREGCDLDERPLEAAAKNEDGAANTPGLFVYGTLMRGECRHHLLAAGYPTCILLAEAPGALHDFGDYPGLRLLNRDEPATCVQGEFLR